MDFEAQTEEHFKPLNAAQIKYYKDEDKIPRLFFKVYYGVGALIYTLMTIGVFIFWLFISESNVSFSSVGLYYMIWVSVLMWISAILTLVCANFSKEVRAKTRLGIRKFASVVAGKLIVDALIFHGLILAIKSPKVIHANEFLQFGGALIFHALLYIVMFIQVVVIIVTITVVEDRLGLCGIMVQDLREEAYKKKPDKEPQEQEQEGGGGETEKAVIEPLQEEVSNV